MEWRTIDSAPKDGTRILACTPDDDPFRKEDNAYICVVHWIAETMKVWKQTDAKTRKLVDEDCSMWATDDGDYAEPTHWMPLPDPPPADGGPA